jgi:hypothetical protein
MITAKELKYRFESPKYKHDLQELSSYAASIKQERPMVLLLAKHFHQQSYKIALEQHHHDLVVDGTTIEFKFHYDFDIPKLQKELNKHVGDIERVWKAAQEGELSKSWSIIPGIYNDICLKRPDIFVWIICARDLSKLTGDDLSSVCLGSRQVNYNEVHPYGPDSALLEVADRFLEKLQGFRKFSLETATIATNGDFPSSYHLRLCDFAVVGET